MITKLEILEKSVLTIFKDRSDYRYHFNGNTYFNFEELENYFENSLNKNIDLIIEFESRKHFKEFVENESIFNIVNYFSNFIKIRNTLIIF